jgi:energy-coupling factor transport system permease protein
MGLLFRLSCLHPRVRLSLFGISIAGAFVHNAAQLSMAYLLMIRHKSIFMFFPWLSLGAIATGWLTAAVAVIVLRRIREARAASASPVPATAVPPASPGLIRDTYVPGDSILHRASLPVKLVVLFFVAVLLLLIDSFWPYPVIFAALAAYAVHFPGAVPALAVRVRKYAVLIGMAFCLPALLTPGGTVLLQAGFVTVTREGLTAGALFAVRNLFLIALGYLVMMTTPLDRMADGFARTLVFLRPVGISGERVGLILSQALISMGFFWEAAIRAVKEADVRRVKGVRKLVPVLGGIVAELYLDARRRGGETPVFGVAECSAEATGKAGPSC